MQKVIIVREGRYAGSRAEDGDYDAYIQTIQGIVDGAELTKPGGEKEKAAEVEIAQSTDEALSRVTGALENYVLVFVTRGMLSRAESIKAANPRLNVVLFTGTFPDDQVKIVTKTARLSSAREAIRAGVFEW